MSFKITYKPFGERSVLIEWPLEIKEAILNDILVFQNKIKNSLIKYIIEVKHAYNSILVTYNKEIDFKNEVDLLKTHYATSNLKLVNTSLLWTIPVCYDSIFGLDLESLAIEKNMSKEVIISTHSEAIYTVYFIGFLPGFLYLGGLNETLYSPRKSTPRLKIEKGAVAIGGNQTGVYPNESPGGWNIIGNTPISFFNSDVNPPCFAKAGDKIKFKSVSLDEYLDIKLLVEAGVFQIENNVFNG